MRLLKKLYEISSPSGKEKAMRKFIKSLLTGMKVDYTEDKHGNIYATKGESDTYPCLVCHTDEVHRVRKKGYRIVESEGLIFGINDITKSFEGIGADDKNGIWVCIKALSEFDVLKCAFFVSEEIGCVGSRSADMKFFEDCRFVAQCDRKGNSDFITKASGTELCSSEFIKAACLKQFGYKEEHGLMTDVMTLKENGLSVSACNISCGYYNPHTGNEMTNISDLYNCYRLVRHLVNNCTDVYPHEYVPVCKGYKGYGGLNYDYYKYGSNTSKWLYEDDDWDYNSYESEYDQMFQEMYNYAKDNENFSVKTFISLYGSKYKYLELADYEFACEDILGIIER